MIDNPTNNQNLELSKLNIEKYPMARSTHLIEYFLIMSYEETYIKEKIINNINIKIESEKNSKVYTEAYSLKKYKCRHLPTILSSISSNISESIANERYLIQSVFPIPPTIFYTSSNNYLFQPNPMNIIFSNIQNNVINICYAYIFYEKYLAYDRSNIYIPKAFVILSQYPFFNTFKNLCKELLYNQFKNDFLEIPIEIQLYNIINFIPAPVNENLNIIFFPSANLSELSKNNSNKDLFNLNDQKIYNLKHLSGYRHSEIDFSIIFCLLPLNIIIQIYLQLLIGNTIAFFSKNMEILNATMYIFQQLFYPLCHDESIYCLSPTRYFCCDFCFQNIVGFLCSYDEINNYNPFRKVKVEEFKCLSEDEEKEDYDYNLYGCDFIVDLDKKFLKEVDNNKKMENYQKHKLEIYEIFNFVFNLINKNKNKNEESSKLEIAIFKLIKRLKKIKSKLKYSEGNENIPNYFNNNTEFNNSIQESFYQFILEISYLYFQNISKYNGQFRISKFEQLSRIKTINESDLNEIDYLFLKLFSKTLYCNILNNFVGGYSKNEPLIYKTPRIIFDYFISLKKILNKMEINNKYLTRNCFDIIDNIYINKGKEINEKDITFLNFYKFYKDKLNLTIYKLINNKYIDAKIDTTDENNIKYYYRYKGINLDRDLLMEYIYIIEDMNINELKQVFQIDNEIPFLLYKPINQYISSIQIYNIFENYFINSNYIEYKDIIILTLVNIVALSIHQKTLIPFAFIIYSLFSKLYFSLRKFIEIILSISYRLFIKDEEQNLFLYEKYFNLYTMCIEANNLFPNDQLIYLKKEIYNFSLKVKNKYKEVLDIKYKKIEKIETEKLYSLESQKKTIEMLTILENKDLEDSIKNKIIFKSKYYRNKIISYNDIYSPKMIYKISKNCLEYYYNDLDFKQVNIYQYEKVLICLLFYSHLFESDLPININRFIFYCLVIDNL